MWKEAGTKQLESWKATAVGAAQAVTAVGLIIGGAVGAAVGAAAGLARGVVRGSVAASSTGESGERPLKRI